MEYVPHKLPRISTCHVTRLRVALFPPTVGAQLRLLLSQGLDSMTWNPDPSHSEPHLSPPHRLWPQEAPSGPHCGGPGQQPGKVAMAGQPALRWDPPLRGIPAVRGLGADGRTLLSRVSDPHGATWARAGERAAEARSGDLSLLSPAGGIGSCLGGEYLPVLWPGPPPMACSWGSRL